MNIAEGILLELFEDVGENSTIFTLHPKDANPPLPTSGFENQTDLFFVKKIYIRISHHEKNLTFTSSPSCLCICT